MELDADSGIELHAAPGPAEAKEGKRKKRHFHVKNVKAKISSTLRHLQLALPSRTWLRVRDVDWRLKEGKGEEPGAERGAKPVAVSEPR